jgi:hypothetical protein
MSMSVSLSEAKTNKLKCRTCNHQIKKGETVLFYVCKGHLDSINCLNCDSGKSELRVIEEENILEDIYGIGQD